MAIQPTFLLIADIAGYTRFMKFHRASLAPGNLKIKLVGHFGEAAVQKVKHLTELAGVDVILALAVAVSIDGGS